MNENNLLPKLLNEVHSYSEDEKAWTALALYYLENVDGHKDLYYLRKAYETKDTIESTTNLAHWLYYEYGEKDQDSN
ncbi:hypothetical protein EGK75_10950 [Neisseria weixii]|uniref:Uncharacterized protein n=1 Tax=Neisseria weixii TaxID=1853276 RepID=A0A3N4MZR1_9NEIS|nr:hypothetical protein [Neisseria weixii]RPD84709.1 hypothetical protein EGK74_10725 [Neisseria weixii]RPD84960.1 hypothetical protein EGK75_10950 [Neisseria weixii]